MLTQKDRERIAVDKTISIMEELGVKYRKNDFFKEGYMKNGAFYSYTLHSFNDGTVETIIRFDDENISRHAKLKKVRLDFFNYFNCRVYENRVVFVFTAKELELEYIKKEDNDKNKLNEVMVKVQKLLALSESDNEHEAISASLMAQKLLAKYNIDMEEVKTSDEEQPIEEAIADVGTGNKWKYTLADVVAKNYRCKKYFKGSEMIVFHGYRQDILIARRVYMYLFSVCKRLGKSYVRKIKEEGYITDGVYNSFCAGFINGVDKELSRQCTELALIIPEAVEKEYKIFSADFGVKNTTFYWHDIKAYAEGEIEGKRALNAQYIDDSSKYIE